jgi:hypothetical protein
MSGLGQQRRFDPVPTMSGLPLTADIAASIGTVAKGQTKKNSVRAYVFRFALEPGHFAWPTACLRRADCVEEVGLWPACRPATRWLQWSCRDLRSLSGQYRRR